MTEKLVRIKRGLDLPISGAPRQTIDAATPVRTVGVVGPDYLGMAPTMAVREGDRVQVGQLLFEDKKTRGVLHTSPAAGVVKGVFRGAKRAFQAVEIEIDGDEEISFGDGVADVGALDRDAVRDRLVASGLWTALRARPFGKVPAIDSIPHSLFVTAIDTNPLAADPSVVLAEQGDDFRVGVLALSRLSGGKTYVCKRAGVDVLAAGGSGASMDSIEEIAFAGPHPAGLPGTHIHFLDPVGPKKTVWHVGYQDVIAVGHLFKTGRLQVERVVALGGPAIENPRLVRTRLGASLDELTAGELRAGGETRVISGSVLAGRESRAPMQFLGRFHQQVSALYEGKERELLGWLRPGFKKFSVKNATAWRLFSRAPLALTTSTEGSPRAMVPVGSYEDVVPLDVIATYLLRALIVGDTDQAQALGCLELDEEDLALCTLVCPGKYDYGPMLRRNLMTIEKDG